MKLDIKNRVDEKGITRYRLAKLLDISYPAATKLYLGEVTRIQLDTLDHLCNVLNCTPNDIFKREGD